MRTNGSATRSSAVILIGSAIAAEAKDRNEKFDPTTVSEATRLDSNWKYHVCRDLAKHHGWPIVPSSCAIGWCEQDTIGVFLDRFNLSS